jgi:hypothetical protein
MGAGSAAQGCSLPRNRVGFGEIFSGDCWWKGVKRNTTLSIAQLVERGTVMVLLSLI